MLSFLNFLKQKIQFFISNLNFTTVRKFFEITNTAFPRTDDSTLISKNQLRQKIQYFCTQIEKFTLMAMSQFQQKECTKIAAIYPFCLHNCLKFERRSRTIFFDSNAHPFGGCFWWIWRFLVNSMLQKNVWVEHLDFCALLEFLDRRK